MFLYGCNYLDQTMVQQSLTSKTENQVRFLSLLKYKRPNYKSVVVFLNICKKCEGVHFPRKHLSVFAVEDSKS